jgi:DNA-binding response OmpR family regulator
MSESPKADNAQPMTLDSAKVLQVDSQAASRKQLAEVLRGIGFEQIAACKTQEEFPDKLAETAPDLLFLDIDGGPDWTFDTIRGIRKGKVGDCPFVVIVALTQKPSLEVVQAALAAGADDMVVKPVTARALRERVVNQIENRKEFIATDDYVGPDRRADERELTEDDPAAIEVPNSLRHAATGDESAALSDERVQETLRNLSVQKFFHLSQKVARISGGQRDLLAGDAGGGDCAAAVEEITETLAEIDELIGEQDFKSVTQVVASTRQALAEIEACGDKITARHFELLHAHGGSIGVVLKESDESAGMLVSALEKAVTVVKGGEGAADAKAGAKADLEDIAEGSGETEPRPSAARAAPDTPAESAAPDTPAESAAPDTPAESPPAPPVNISLKVRFKAWWDGVDPSETSAGRGRA